MISALELNEWASDVLPCMMDANTALKNLIILDHENSNELKEKVPELISCLRHQQEFILIVQLDKIFSISKNQKRNVNKLCNRLGSEPLDDEIKQKLNENSSKLTDVFRNENDIQSAIIKIRMELLKYKTTIGNIRSLRNKVYAHTDPATELININLSELRNLLHFANDIYNTLFGKIFDRFYFLEQTDRWDFRNLIELANH